MTLQDKLDAHKKSFQSKAPKEALEVMQRALANLKDSGIMEHTLNVGDVAPDFKLKDSDGNTVSLNELLSQGPVVLGFYRGRW